MSRSYKKVCAGGFTTARTDKWFKVQEHKRYRSNIHTLIMGGEEEIFPDYDGKYGDPWCSPKDGHSVYYWSLNSYLKTAKVYSHARTGPLYTPIWSNRQWRHIVYSDRPATRGDWKKLMSK